ncbi:lipase member K-like, partial [Ornithodoros turicata]|uniref:lipase member K-like n=1 Tax=Ornithodoros turicata TaxID=34597 RepID=UPI003139402E
RIQAELIRSKGYPAQEFQVTTTDGYVLSLQRIPSDMGTPVLLVHGLLSSAVEWVINFPNQSLGFLLADAGYDVWLGNFRGTPYARGHLRYSDKDSEYWRFSLDQVALYDIPTLIDFVLSRTGRRQLFYAGFSQGNTALWATLADLPQYNDKVYHCLQWQRPRYREFPFFRQIRLAIALAPVATMNYIKSPARFLVPFSPLLTGASVWLNRGRLLVGNESIKRATYFLCESPLRYLCVLPTYFLFGVNLPQVNITRLPVYVSHIPSGAAKRNVQQYAQIIRARNFVKYDYGTEGNLQRYGQARSPAYDISKITAPVALFYSQGDFFANPQDVAYLRRNLPNVVFEYLIPEPSFAHLDFVLGVNAVEVLYKPIIRLLDTLNSL